MKMSLRAVVWVTGAILLNITGSLCQLDVCGYAPLKPRIVGGQTAAEGSWPWQASIHYRLNDGLLCGGSLINKNWVLSAAQCFQSISSSNIIIYLGRHWRISTNPNEISSRVNRIIIHPEYDSNNQKNDIALLQLSSSVSFSDRIRPVCLAASGSSFSSGLDSWIAGWGSTDTGGNFFPNALQEVKVPVVSNRDCKSAYGSLITDNTLCAGLSKGGKDSCVGDGGSPLVNNATQWVQSGIASFGRGCAQPKYPGVYTRVSQYQSWISSQISGDQPGFIKFKSSAFRSSPSISLCSVSLTLSIFPLIFSLSQF